MKSIETIEERVRNKIGTFYSINDIFKDINKENNDEIKQQKINYLINNSYNISNAMNNSINYLIEMSKIIDEHLPNDFDINKLLDKN